MRIREPEPGDIGWIIASHGEVYAREFGFDASFEFGIANKLAQHFSAADGFNRIWIAEMDGERAGSIAVRPIGDSIAFIHFVLVLERFRGSGIARALLERVVDHATAHERRLLRLETFDCLTDARELYRRSEFELVECNALQIFGHARVQEFWERSLD